MVCIDSAAVGWDGNGAEAGFMNPNAVIARSPSDEAIQSLLAALDCFVATLLAMTRKQGRECWCPD
jgi:hypothetical protein